MTAEIPHAAGCRSRNKATVRWSTILGPVTLLAASKAFLIFSLKLAISYPVSKAAAIKTSTAHF